MADSEYSQESRVGSSMDNPVDLLIIGGGINGSGVARDAAGRGLSVVLCEKGDLAEGTSSRSSKFIHGGLRYLEHYEFRLVRESLQEREVVLAAAPHLARPLQLILPHSPEQRPQWLIRMGLLLYDNLSRRKRVPGSGAVDLSNGPIGETLRSEFRKAFSYWDVWADDSRLVAVNALDASRRGARILTRTECVSAHRDGHLWRAELKSRIPSQNRTVHAKAIFNAAGPWVGKVVRNVAGLNSSLKVRLVKGSHIVLPKWWKGTNGFALQSPDRRLVFAYPYLENMAVVGTTDIPFEGDPDNAEIDESESEYLLKVLSQYFQVSLTRKDILSDYSGVRPLFDDDAGKDASSVTRDYEFELNGSLDADSSLPPMLSVYGGKLTTYRKLSEQALNRLAPFFPNMRKSWTSNAPLPGGNLPGGDYASWFAGFKQEYPFLDEKLLEHLGQCYGSESNLLLSGVKNTSGLGTHFGGQFYEIEAKWLTNNEWAQQADDFLYRRTKHGLFLDSQQRTDFERWLKSRNT